MAIALHPLAAVQPAHPERHAIVLAGGRGERLRGLTARRAKPAVAFGGTLRLLDFTLANCLNSGITRLSVLTQYRGDTIERHLQGLWWNTPGGSAQIDVLASTCAHGYLGTADAVHQQLDRLRRQGVRQVLVLAGDHVCKMDLRRLLQSHTDSGAGLTVAALEVPAAEAAGTFGVLQVNAFGQVTGFDEKPACPACVPGRDGQALVSLGIYAADLDLLQAILVQDAADPHSRHDFGHDVLPRVLAEGLLGVHRFERSCVRAHGAPPYWRDVGSLDSYWRAHQDLTGPAPALDLFDPSWPIQTCPRNGPPTHLRAGPLCSTTFAGSLLGDGCQIDAASVRGSVLSSGVCIGRGSTVDESVLLPGTVLGRRVQLRRVIVDEGCRLPDGMRIGFDASEDRAHFHVTASGITLVTAEMLSVGAREARPRPVRAAGATAQPLRA